MDGAEAERELLSLTSSAFNIATGFCLARGSPEFSYFTGSGDQGRKRMIGHCGFSTVDRE